MKRILFISIQFILFVFLAGFLALIVFFCNQSGGEISAYILLSVCFLLSVVLIPVLHEVGHLIVGKICGMRLHGVRFCFVDIRRKGEKLNVQLVNPFTAATAGDCRMYPTDAKKIRERFTFFALGGLLLQAAYILLLLPVVILVNNPFLWASVGATLPYCGYLLLVNLIPFSSQYDGAIIFGLIKNEPSMVTATHIFTIQGYLAQGYTPSEIDKSLYFNSPQLSEDDVYFSLIQYYRYAYYLDGGEKQKAVESILRLEDCLEYLPTEYLLPICSEITFTYCRLQEDKEAAECYYAFVQELKENEGTLDTLRSEFAYATLCGNEKEKEEILLRLEYALEQEPLAGVRKYEKKLLKELYGV